MKKTILIIDGLNYLWRAYFGVPKIIRSKKGTQINAVFGFFSFLREAIVASKAKYILVVFDSENAVSKKQEEYPEYKSNRVYDESTISMFDQLKIIKEILSLMNIQHIEEEEIEADDLIGEYSSLATKNGYHVFIASNDFDFMQLISKNIHVIRSSKGIQSIYTRNEVIDKFGIPPEKYQDFIALKGDKGDNIMGVPGIGNEIAKKLILKYLSVENLLLNTSSLTENIRKKIESHTNDIVGQKKLVTIKLTQPIDHKDLESFKYNHDKLFTKTNEYIEKIGL